MGRSQKHFEATDYLGKQSDRPENTMARKNDDTWRAEKGFLEEVTFDLGLGSEVGVDKMKIYSLSSKSIAYSLCAHLKKIGKNAHLLHLKKYRKNIYYI